MASRQLNQPKQSQKKPILAPERKLDWQRLLRLAIQRAELTQDRRLTGLQKALSDGRAEPHLRLLGIIHPGDLDREFPSPSK